MANRYSSKMKEWCLWYTFCMICGYRRPQKFRSLAQNDDANERLKALYKVRCPSDVVVSLTHDSSEMVRREAYYHKNLPAYMMEKAIELMFTWDANYVNAPARGASAPKRESNNPNHILNNLAVTSDTVETFPETWAVQHKNCPEHIMVSRMEHSLRVDAAGRRAVVAVNRGITERVQLMFLFPALDTVENRDLLSKNPALTSDVISRWIPLESNAEILRRFAYRKDATEPNRQAALTRLLAVAALASQPLSKRDRLHLTHHSNNPEDIARALAPYPNNRSKRVDWEVLLYALRNNSTPESIIVATCQHPEQYFREIAAQHSACPEEWRVYVALNR